MGTAEVHQYIADLDIIQFCQKNRFPVRSHPFFRDIEKSWPFVLCELDDAAVIGPYSIPLCKGQLFFDALSNFGQMQRKRMEEHGGGGRRAISVDEAVLISGNASIGHFIDVHAMQTLYFQLFENLSGLPVITMANMPRGSYEIFSILGCPQERLLKIGAKDAVICKKLHVPTVVGGVEHDYLGYSIPGKLCRMFRDMLTVATFGTTTTSIEPFRKIFIQRKNTGWKGIKNEEEVENFVTKMGFELVDPGKISILEQVKIAHETRYFVTSSGSQMHLADFAQAGAELLIFSSRLVPTRPSWQALKRFPALDIKCSVAFFPHDEDEKITIDIKDLYNKLGKLGFGD